MIVYLMILKNLQKIGVYSIDEELKVYKGDQEYYNQIFGTVKDVVQFVENEVVKDMANYRAGLNALKTDHGPITQRCRFGGR